MNKLISYLLSFLFPVFAYASGGSLSFTPPPNDYSVRFLGNIFGVVDGVLHGTGGQILGQMFAVFNAAVLALGGVVIIYTLLVSTLNTANEGQMLGQKWNSLWVPVRATLGLALLIPKASGYCVMQIFVMWVVLQGIGAADKVWNAALSYLNRGGAIMPAQNAGAFPSIMGYNVYTSQGASVILASQACMLGLQYILTATRQGYLDAAAKQSGPCAGNPDETMKTFCDNPVPNFINSVNAVTYQSDQSSQTAFTLNMPNFDSSSPYNFLNGSCGTISWNAIQASDFGDIQLSPAELQTATMSRAIAIQQLYMDLSVVAQAAVSNDPQLNKQANSSDTQTLTSAIAIEQFGVPINSNGTACFGGCEEWGKDPSLSTTVIYTGYEFLQAIQDYNSIMQPTLTMINQSQNSQAYNEVRSFIDKAEQQGWLMAGSYFFMLAQINSNVVSNTSSVQTSGDEKSGLQQSTFTGSAIQQSFDSNCQSPYKTLCLWLSKDVKPIKNMMGLIDGSTILSTPVPTPNFLALGYGGVTMQSGVASSTVYGYTMNTEPMVLPGQPGLVAPTFKFKIVNPAPATTVALPPIDFDCGPILGLCITREMGNLFYNDIIRVLLNWIILQVMAVVNIVIGIILYLPLNAIATIFQKALTYLTAQNMNPIINLANMGVYYINFSIDLFFIMVLLLLPLLAIPVVDFIVLGVVALALPLLLAFFAIMVGIGFITAFYVPFVPYLIFTFATLGWFMAVIEAMVAAPIVALGVTHPEGEGPFGKGEQGLMILMNVFLRPAMMVIGYIAGIILSYVAVWLINAGFGQVVYFIQGCPESPDPNEPTPSQCQGFSVTSNVVGTPASTSSAQGYGYSSWAGMLGFFFSVLTYTFLYLIVVQKSFNLITILPDKVLRWMGGQQETYGQDTAQWADEVKGKIEKSGEEAHKATSQVADKAAKGVMRKITGAKLPAGGTSQAEGEK